MKIEDFQKHSHELVDWMFKYLKEIEKYPIKPNISKTFSWRSLGGYVAVAEVFNKIFIYYVHERIWDKQKIGN